MLLEITFEVEPSGPAYEQLLSLAAKRCRSLLLVVRNEIGLSKRAEGALLALMPFQISQRLASEWPGTKLVGNRASVIEFRFSPMVAGIMQQATGRLFDWIQPELPEDPCLISHEGEPWLVTVSHERDAFLRLPPGDLELMRIEGPDLFKCLEKV